MNSDYFTEAQNASIASYAFLSNKEWLEVFPESKDTLHELRNGWIQEADRLTNIGKRLERTGTIEDHISALVLVEPRIEKAQKHIRRLSAYIAVAFPQESKSPITQDEIECAREVPLHRILSVGERTYKVLCPFHREKTPSCTIYRKNNTFHCFGCGAHGDSIDLIQKLNDLSFVAAVRYLNTL